MPRLVGEDDAERIVQIHLQHPLPRLVEGPAVNLLPLVIQLLQLARDRVRLVLVFSEKQLDTADRVAQPSSGIQPRREDEAEPAGRERLSIETSSANERAEPDVARLGQHPETIAHEDPVL